MFEVLNVQNNMNTSSNQFSFLKGYSFIFKDGSNTIELWFSCLSGLEKVKVNGELVVKQRSLSIDSNNSFKIENSIYRTNLKVKNIFKGPYICSLFKNEKLLKQQKLTFPGHGKNAPWYGKWWFSIMLGLFIAITSTVFKYPLWAGFILMIVIFIFIYMKGSNQKPFIEEINVEDI